MSSESTKKETSAPVTAAKSGRGSSEAYAAILRCPSREQHTPFLPSGIKAVFAHMPKSLHKRKVRTKDLEDIRGLRNRVFHHERIVHWRDLDAQHDLILNVIGWINPELQKVTATMDRFQTVRAAGLTPFLSRAVWEPTTP